jgi:tRNA nucleotidyltransferase (CCA-adding enzyme)
MRYNEIRQSEDKAIAILPGFITQCIGQLQAEGYEAYLVGGSVRDLCLGEIPKDFDLCTNATPPEIERVFAEMPHKTYGKQHGTVGVLFEKSWVEITTYRKDGDYSDHRRPDAVLFTQSLEEDLCRRDFTINAMAMDISGNLIDFYGGEEDLKNKILRCVGIPHQRFDEDALRILRALRFASRLGFAIEEQTSDAIHRHAYLLKEIAVERIREELKGILTGEHAHKTLSDYDDVFGILIAEIESARGFVQFNPDQYEDLLRHSMRVLSFTEQDLTLRLAALLHDLGKLSGLTLNPDHIAIYEHHAEKSALIALDIMNRLKFDKKTSREVAQIIALHESSFPELLPEMCRWVAKIGDKILLQGIRLRECDLFAQAGDQSRKLKNCIRARELVMEIKNRHLPYLVRHLKIDGNDLLELGLRGSAIQNMLERLLNFVVEGKVLNRREDLRSLTLTLDTKVKTQ